MKIFLKLKHWQLFLFTWGLGILMNLLMIVNINVVFRAFPFVMMTFTFGFFGWIWAISTTLQTKLPAGVKLNVTQFKILFPIPVVYILVIMVLTGSMTYFRPFGEMNEGSMGVVIGLFLFLHLFSMVCIFLGLRFAAKTMKSVELGRMAKFSDYAGEFFLIWFSVIGVWVLQPRLNKLVKESNE